MKNIILLSISLFLLGLSACKKNDLPEPINSTPAIWLQAEVNGVPTRLESGENAFYTTTISRMISDNLREFVFYIEAPDLKKSVKITIYSSKDTITPLEDDLNASITPRTYKFAYSNSAWYLCKNSEVIITYYDHVTGRIYNTIPYNQEISGNFDIVSVTDREFEGITYKMAELNFNCHVKDYQGNIYNITNGKGMIPFGDRGK